MPTAFLDPEEEDDLPFEEWEDDDLDDWPDEWEEWPDDDEDDE